MPDMCALENVEETFPLTPAQRGMVFETLSNPNQGIYVGLFHTKLPDDINLIRFKKMWNQVVDRHPALRTLILPSLADGPSQQVVKKLPLEIWQEERLVDQTISERLDVIHKLPVRFNLAPALRLHIIKDLDAGCVWFAWASHHALVDDWSAVTVLREVETLYRDGSDAELGDALHFSEFVKWQQNKDPAPAETFWKASIGSFQTPSALRLETINSKLPETEQSQCVETSLSAERTKHLNETAKALRVTPTALISTAWGIALQMISGQNDVLFGLAATQRPPELHGSQKAVGNFVTVLPARLRFDNATTLRDLIRTHATEAMSSIEHAQIPLQKLHEISDVPLGEALFDTVLSIESAWSNANQQDIQGSLFAKTSARDKSHYAMSVLVSPGTTLSIRLQFDGTLYTLQSAQLALTLFTQALNIIPDHLDTASDVLPLTSVQEKSPPPQLPLPESNFVHSLFAKLAAENPDASALITNEQTVSYSELNFLANAWASEFINRQLGPGDCISIVMDRSPNAIIAMIAALKAGCTYAPIDPVNPPIRLQKMLVDCGTSLVLTTRDYLSSLGSYRDVALSMDASPVPLAQCPQLSRPLEKTDTAYILFTSGSTGTPKGVAISHSNLAYSTAARSLFYKKNPKAFLLLSPIAFDSSVAGIYWTLTTGGTIVLPDAGHETDAHSLVTLMEKGGVTHTLALPTLLATIAETIPDDSLSSLRTLIAAGEPLVGTDIDKLASAVPQAEIYNEYGPTEATVWCLAVKITDSMREVVPIGSPIPGTTVCVRDTQRRLVPDGLPGELYVSGPGVAKEYVNNEAETAAAFSDDPSTGVATYATGDLARRRFDGHFDYLGRVDNQIKIRGRRIELREIESVLAALPAVERAAVIITGDKGKERLIAFASPAPRCELQENELVPILKNTLPKWMQPDQVIILKELPTTSTGKLDRRALSKEIPQKKLQTNAALFTRSSTPLEEKLCEIWSVILNADKDVHIEGNFFDLGGNSLSAMRLINRIEEELNLKIPFSVIGKISTVEQQALQIENYAGGIAHTFAQSAHIQNTADPFAGLTQNEADMLRSYMDKWPGKPATEGGLFRLMNPLGKKTPLIWCFNNGFEFERLANRLGKDQPVYGIRSGNLILDMTAENQRANNRRVALHALPELLRILPNGPYLFGGNCQGAAIVMEMAQVLQGLGRSISAVILMEAVPVHAFHGNVALIFGKDSMFNPYLSYHDPDLAWSRMFQHYTVDIIPGQHGVYFDRLHVGRLASTVKRVLEDAQNRAILHLQPSDKLIEWAQPDRAFTPAAGKSIPITIRAKNAGNTTLLPTKDSGIRVANRWLQNDGTVIAALDGFSDITEAWVPDSWQTFSLIVQVPKQGISDILEIDVVEDGIARFSDVNGKAIKIDLKSNNDRSRDHDHPHDTETNSRSTEKPETLSLFEKIRSSLRHFVKN